MVLDFPRKAPFSVSLLKGVETHPLEYLWLLLDHKMNTNLRYWKWFSAQSCYRVRLVVASRILYAVVPTRRTYTG